MNESNISMIQEMIRIPSTTDALVENFWMNPARVTKVETIACWPNGKCTSIQSPLASIWSNPNCTDCRK